MIYVAGKYSADSQQEREANTQQAIIAGVELERMGHHAIVPHLSHYLDTKAKLMGIEIDYEVWMEHGLFLLSLCDAMLVISDSPGVQREIKFAHEHHIPIYHGVDRVSSTARSGRKVLRG